MEDFDSFNLLGEGDRELPDRSSSSDLVIPTLRNWLGGQRSGSVLSSFISESFSGSSLIFCISVSHSDDVMSSFDGFCTDAHSVVTGFPFDLNSTVPFYF